MYLTQKEVAQKARLTEFTYRAYELDDCNPKLDILDRIANTLGIRPDYLNAPTFRNRRKLAYAILKNEDSFHYATCDIDGVLTIEKGTTTPWTFSQTSTVIEE